MRLYTGFDLHSSNTYLGIEDEGGKRIFKKKLPNDIAVGTSIAGRPPHGSVLEALPHTALTSGSSRKAFGSGQGG